MKRWQLAVADEGLARDLARQAGVPFPVARALAARGIVTSEAVDRFLKPRLSELSDPFELPDATVAVRRIWRALDEAEPITVYGDYDVDGVTATALMVTVLRALGARVSACLPNRIDEGYGLTPESLARCLEENPPGLMITVDCGTGSHEAVARAKEAGVDVVVTDHHPPSGPPAAALAVVNPKCGGQPHQRHLAGVGVAFKLCHAILKAGRERGNAAAAAVDLREFLDLVALGTIADVVPVLGENRTLVRHGLACVNGKSRVGLRALAEVAGVTGEMGAYHVGFVLGPRLNAAGRLGQAELALELLLTGDAARAGSVASALDEANRERRRIEAEMLATAIRRIDAGFDPERHFAVVVGEDGWHVGVVGIVAARLAARYGRPAVVVGFDESGLGRGSCRGIDGFDLAGTLKLCACHLHKHGGHEKAAGLELHRCEFEAFQQAFHGACAGVLGGRDLRPELRVDAWVTVEETTTSGFFDALARLEPFGEQNPEPVWAARGVRVVGAPRKVGTDHLKLTVGDATRRTVDAIGFGMADRPLPDGPIDAAFMVRKNTYLGRQTLQWQLVDWRPADG